MTVWIKDEQTMREQTVTDMEAAFAAAKNAATATRWPTRCCRRRWSREKAMMPKQMIHYRVVNSTGIYFLPGRIIRATG